MKVNLVIIIFTKVMGGWRAYWHPLYAGQAKVPSQSGVVTSYEQVDDRFSARRISQ